MNERKGNGMAKKILIIDDDQDLFQVLKVRLEANKFEVITAIDGMEGLEKAKSENPDLIVLDILMPKKDGYMVVKELKSNEGTKDIPVIVMSGKDTLKILFEEEGVTDYFVKPLDTQKLLETINVRLTSC